MYKFNSKESPNATTMKWQFIDCAILISDFLFSFLFILFVVCLLSFFVEIDTLFNTHCSYTSKSIYVIFINVYSQVSLSPHSIIKRYAFFSIFFICWLILYIMEKTGVTRSNFFPLGIFMQLSESGDHFYFLLYF